MKFWKRWITDIRDATRHCSLAQRGAYDALLDEYYSQERGLPDDMGLLYRMANAFDAAERSAVDTVLKQFFVLSEDGLWHNARADRYLSEEIPRMVTWHERAKKGAAARWGKPDAHGEVKKKKPRVNGHDALAGFEPFWSLYPNRTGRGAAEKAWKKVPAVAHEQIMLAVAAQSTSERWTKEGGQYIPNPATWLNQKRWLDEPPQEPERGLVL